MFEILLMERWWTGVRGNIRLVREEFSANSKFLRSALGATWNHASAFLVFHSIPVCCFSSGL